MRRPTRRGVRGRAQQRGGLERLRQVIDLAKQGKVSVDVTTYPLADGLRAFADLEAGTVPGRAVLVP